MGPLIVFLACALSSAIAWSLCRNAQPISDRLQLLDIPGERKRHASITPLMGGVVLLAAVLPVAALVASRVGPADWTFRVLLWCDAVAAMAIIGIADDCHSLSARSRLALSFLVFLLVSAYDTQYLVRVLGFEHPEFLLGLGTGWLAIIFTAVCCVGLINAVNMADGKNGLVIGLCLGWLGLLSLRAPPPLTPVIAVLAAGAVVLLIFNLRGKLFLGDGGSYGLATAVALLAILIYNTPGAHAGRAIAAEELMVLFAVPVLDAFRLTFARIRRGLSPMSADRDHLHHHLLDRFGWPRGLVIYWLVALLPAAVVLTLA